MNQGFRIILTHPSFLMGPNFFLRPKIFLRPPIFFFVAPKSSKSCARFASDLGRCVVGPPSLRARPPLPLSAPVAASAHVGVCSRSQRRAGSSPRSDARKCFQAIIGGCSGAASGSPGTGAGCNRSRRCQWHQLRRSHPCTRSNRHSHASMAPTHAASPS